ncbi:hypothetical protein cyc_03802 [Cyclospora cayetanensis]|uniref:Uncharacterized protein n=1 Tax=Cyclospora cayetanensis TaxID=88456 RepID=A0A1D3CSF8_9EIME|nr:hypothetical protein cyc_03802 [Cyclospora cayetanensis]
MRGPEQASLPTGSATASTLGRRDPLNPIQEIAGMENAREIVDMLSSDELPADWPPAGRPAYRIKVYRGSVMSYVQQYRMPPQHAKEFE